MENSFVHLFEWKWRDIALECERFLGPKGFRAVQVSPPTEHVLLEKHPWYQRYQPVSYKVESRSGNRQEFRKMTEACKKAGVEVYVDAVINHMSAVLDRGEKKYGSSGSPYMRYRYPGTYEPKDFHDCGLNGNNDIVDFTNPFEVWNCELLNLADLKSESSFVRKRIARYLNDLISLGVRGFRVDAAKHMPPKDLKAIFAKLKKPVYIFQEVIDLGGKGVKADEYFETGWVTEFKYSYSLSAVVRNEEIAKLNGESMFGEEWGFVPNRRAVVFVDNHDNQRGHGGGGGVLTYKDGDLHTLANILMLAWPYGYPRLMSSYDFKEHWQGPPSTPDGKTKNAIDHKTGKCQKGWVCEHRKKPIVGMIGFRKATAAEPRVTDWWTNGKNQIAFGRGSLGFIVVNREEKELKRTFQTSMPAGRYCSVTTGKILRRSGQCSGLIVQVDEDGKFRAKIPPMRALAIHEKSRVN